MILKKTSYFESFDGTKIYYEIHGQGEPIILCYGIGCLINHWNHQIKYFSKNYQVIAFDYRGHNQSGIPKNTSYMNLDSLVKDLQALTTHLKLKKFHLWGHSFGVPLILEYLSKDTSNKTKSAVLINGFLENPLSKMFQTNLTEKIFFAIKKMQESMPESTSYLWQKLLNNQLSVYAAGLLGGFNLKTAAFKDIEVYTKGISHVDLDSFIHLFTDLVNYNGRVACSQIMQPVLLIGGKKDTITPMVNQQQMADCLTNSEIIITNYGSHCTQLDLPEFVNLKIEKFMSELTK
jgi:pimeloyl-ACP methyl ester carboxylesterase